MQNEAIYTEEYKNCLIKIYQDENCQLPSEWGDDGMFITAYHRDFSIDSKEISKNECIALAGGDMMIERERLNELKNKYWYFGLEAYIHSGVVLALSHEGNFPDRNWDVSQLGMVFVTKTEAKTRERAKKMAQGLIETWNDCLSGNVYGFMTEDEKNGIDIDSWWGFYGDYNKSGILDEAKNSIDFYLKKERKEAKNKKADFSLLSLGALLSSENEGIRRNAIGILKQLQKEQK